MARAAAAAKHHDPFPPLGRRRSVEPLRYTLRMPDRVHELLATEVALDKLGARGIAAEEAAQVPRNLHVTVRNPGEGRRPDRRRLLIGATDGGRVVTLVIETTIEPTTWLIVTGWSSTDAERKLLAAARR